MSRDLWALDMFAGTAGIAQAFRAKGFPTSTYERDDNPDTEDFGSTQLVMNSPMYDECLGYMTLPTPN